MKLNDPGPEAATRQAEGAFFVIEKAETAGQKAHFSIGKAETR